MPRGTALITGASSGIGADLAGLCAANGYDLILVARRVARLREMAARLAEVHHVQARALEADLSDPTAPQAIFDATRDAPIAALINNAGFGVRGPFEKTNWADEARLIQVNTVAPVHLCKLFLPGMIERGSGRILNIASTAAFVPGPFMAMYYASKAFLLSFSESIANELKGSRVTVTVVCPGPTRTEFVDVAGITNSNLFKGSSMSSDEVARIAYEAMQAGKVEVIAGARNRWMMRSTRLAPRTMLANITRRLNTDA